jgi:hypothetical protein
LVDSQDGSAISISIAEGELILHAGGEPKCQLTVISDNRFAICNTSNLWLEFSSPKGGAAQQLIIHDASGQITAHRR